MMMMSAGGLHVNSCMWRRIKMATATCLISMRNFHHRAPCSHIRHPGGIVCVRNGNAARNSARKAVVRAWPACAWLVNSGACRVCGNGAKICRAHRPPANKYNALAWRGIVRVKARLTCAINGDSNRAAAEARNNRASPISEIIEVPAAAPEIAAPARRCRYVRLTAA